MIRGPHIALLLVTLAAGSTARPQAQPGERQRTSVRSQQPSRAPSTAPRMSLEQELASIRSATRSCLPALRKAGVDAGDLSRLEKRLSVPTGCSREDPKLARLADLLGPEVRTRTSALTRLANSTQGSRLVEGSSRSKLTATRKQLATLLDAIVQARDAVQAECAGGDSGVPTRRGATASGVATQGGSPAAAAKRSTDALLAAFMKLNIQDPGTSSASSPDLRLVARGRALIRGKDCGEAQEQLRKEIVDRTERLGRLELQIHEAVILAAVVPFPFNLPFLETLADLRASVEEISSLLGELNADLRSSCQNIADDCIPFDLSRLTAAPIDPGEPGSRWRLQVGDRYLKVFPDQAQASRALAVLEYYRLDQTCYVGRPDPSLTYYLAAGAPPAGAMAGEDCMPLDVEAVKISRISGHWKLVQGSRWIADFGNRHAEAEKALAILLKHEFTRICYVGRPGPSLTYLRR
jgi:hypothetical protein